MRGGGDGGGYSEARREESVCSRGLTLEGKRASLWSGRDVCGPQLTAVVFCMLEVRTAAWWKSRVEDDGSDVGRMVDEGWRC